MYRCFAFLASVPGLYRKKCKACQHDDHFNSKKCKTMCEVDIQSPGRPKGTTASEGYGVSVVLVTCSYLYHSACVCVVRHTEHAHKTLP